MSKSSADTADRVVSWYKKNARDLPWRHTLDPYKIWVSEIILQQTTVRQGTDYYIRFIKKYPTVNKLANAKIDAVLKLWQGLGYYSRARNMHASAKIILKEYGGTFPKTHKEIIALKGVGPYTAAAISSFAFNLSYPVVDGNVLRFISRYYAIEKPIDITETKHLIEKKTDALLKTQKPSEFNQAIMEFGALMCTAKNPHCNICPLSSKCTAFKKNLVSILPFKSKKIKKRKRFFKFIFFIDHNNKTIITKRTFKDIWQGLYQFPLQELEELNHELPDLNIYKVSTNRDNIQVSDVLKQQLTHQTIHAQFYKVFVDLSVSDITTEKHKVVKVKDLNKYAWPKIIDLYLNDKSFVTIISTILYVSML